jgi:hypothetical protein
VPHQAGADSRAGGMHERGQHPLNVRGLARCDRGDMAIQCVGGVRCGGYGHTVSRVAPKASAPFEPARCGGRVLVGQSWATGAPR